MPAKLRLVLLVLSVFLSSCFFFHQGHEVAITGKVRAPIDEDNVKFFLSPPERYEVIGAVGAQAHQMTSSHRISDMLDEMRDGAARVGANGVLLDPAQINLPAGVTSSTPYDQDDVQGFINTDENLRGKVIYFGPDAPLQSQAQIPAAPAAAAMAATAPQPKPHNSYVTVVVTDTGDEAKNLAIANRTCSKLDKLPMKDKDNGDGTISYICVDK